MNHLTNAERNFYARHLSIRDFGETGQAALKAARVLVIGAGGLGCPVLQYLAASGVGSLGVVDADKVDVSNLQRQILFQFDDCGKSKAQVACVRLAKMNPHIKVVAHETWFDERNAMTLIADYDVVVDGTDNFATKFLINDACWFAKKPLVFGSIFQFEGQVSVFNALESDGVSRGPNYRDLLPAPPPPELAPNCSEAGVIGVVPGIIGCLQASEAIKLITGLGEILSGKLLTFDALDCRMSVLTLLKSAKNPLSGATPAIMRLRSEDQSCATGVQQVDAISIERVIELSLRMRVQLVDVRDAHERARSIGGLNMPLSGLTAEYFNDTGVEAIVLYCESGVRSAIASRRLQGNVPASVYTLEGGVKKLLSSGVDLSEIAQRILT
jgi:molybdopterin/thiamine biosynthesis adenylyltransferase/rhodanese-related sulfurtransferase